MPQFDADVEKGLLFGHSPSADASNCFDFNDLKDPTAFIIPVASLTCTLDAETHASNPFNLHFKGVTGLELLLKFRRIGVTRGYEIAGI